jgi:DNA-binding MarR family transcriptional regulator
MSSVSSGAEGLSGPRRALATGVRDRLRSLRGEFAALNHVVGSRLKVRDSDLDCLDLLARLGPVGPSELARRSGVHPATMTGILDRLQKAEWVVRERDPAAADRRGVVVRIRPERMGQVLRLYSGMIAAVDGICAEYSADELELIDGFLDRVAAAGRAVTADLASSASSE